MPKSEVKRRSYGPDSLEKKNKLLSRKLVSTRKLCRDQKNCVATRKLGRDRKNCVATRKIVWRPKNLVATKNATET